MSKEAFVFEVSNESFDKYILTNSEKIPVFVEFMGVWSGPSVYMSELFAELAAEFAEQFIFAKVDIDEQPELRDRFKIENVPTMIVFQNGEQVRTEVGQLHDSEARRLLSDFGIFRESDRQREQALEMHLGGDTAGAMNLLAEAAKNDPANVRIALDMVQIFLDIGAADQAKALFARIPEEARKTDIGTSISFHLPFAEMAQGLDDLETLLQRAQNPEDLSARFDLSVRLLSQYQYEEAMDHLFAILEQEPEFKEGAARELIVYVSNTIAPVNAELAQVFRRRLANLSG